MWYFIHMIGIFGMNGKGTELTLDEALSKPTVSVQDAGKLFFNLSRNAAYDAAKRGDFQTIKIGGKIVVPVAPIAAKLGLTMKIGAAV
ncbi:hypothetical protein EOA33_25610 [Mesorhizobium sp. M4A.F.Ca.ET.050.02.1.1]|nr:hypothetical protein EOA33_25610 [Mesorhizobium sp. M4A.F.Ca.ET.050.02.1.1]